MQKAGYIKKILTLFFNPVKICSMNEHLLKEEIFNTLRVLSSNNNLTQRDLSAYMGFSLGKTNYLLKSLAQKGFLKIKGFTSEGDKLRKVSYLLTKKGAKEKLKLTYYFLKKKEAEYLGLKKEFKDIPRNVIKELINP